MPEYCMHVLEQASVSLKPKVDVHCSCDYILLNMYKKVEKYLLNATRFS
jgi:hypothetical protein